MDFQNSPPYERSASFYVTITGIMNVFNTSTLKQIFWKKITNTENATFPYKTTLLEK